MKKNRLLIVIDMQNDFITGPLGSDAAAAIIPNVVEKVKNWDGMIFFTQDGHGQYEFEEELMMTEETKRIPPHCLSMSEGREIISELKDYVNDNCVFHKTIFGNDWWSRYTAPQLDLFDEIEIIGVCTDICVISNALILRSLDEYIPITVDASCCAGTSPEAHKAALMVMKNCCINVINED